MKNLIIAAFLIITVFTVEARHKVYLIHGYAGLGIEMEKLRRAAVNAGFETEIFSYPSLQQDIDTVAQALFHKIQVENPDTVSFITHSMGALVARSIYNYLDTATFFPHIHRMVMIAPPNKGTPVADFFVQSRIARFLGGPNIENLTTDPNHGAYSYPIPNCEVGIILGVRGRGSRGYNLFLEEDNDGLVLPKHAILGIEKDIAFVNASHTAILIVNKTEDLVLQFLNRGTFEKNNK